MEVECKTKTEDEENDVEIKDKIEYQVQATNRGASVKVEYKNEIEMEDVETETETQYEIFFDRIVEFVGSNSDGSYSFENNDEELTVIELRDWDRFSEIETSDDGVVSHFFLKSTNGMIEFKFTISRADEGAAVTANKMKIDFRLTGFPWTREDSDVALFCSVESKKKVEVEREDVDPTRKGKAKDVMISFNEALEGSGIVPFGSYTWATAAEVTSLGNSTNTTTGDVAVSSTGDAATPEGDATNGTQAVTSVVRVIATSPEMQVDEKMEVIAFSFIGDGSNNADEVYWDPEAGIAYASGSSAVRAFGLVMSGIASALLVMLM